MDYVFGTLDDREVLTVKGAAHSELSGYRQIERIYPDKTVTDNFRIVRREWSAEDSGGKCYDRYEIDHHYRVIDSTRPLRTALDSTTQASSIAFVALAQSGNIDDATASEHADLFLEWSPLGIHYAVNDIRRDPLDSKLYKVIQAHNSQEGWNPSLQPALWRCIGDPAEEWPEWSQPLGAHDAYAAGDKVTRNGEHYVSDVDGNVWPPETYGWHREG